MDPEERRDENVSGDEESTSDESVDIDWSSIEQFIQTNPDSSSTKLFSFLALLNAYVPESYLVMSECQQVLGPPEPIHGGPPFEERMRPFLTSITWIDDPDEVCLFIEDVAEEAVQLLKRCNISMYNTARHLIQSLCGAEVQPHTIQFLEDLLTKREMHVTGKKHFSRFIEEIRNEKFWNAVNILKMATMKFRNNPTFPQTLSRLLYSSGHYNLAERYAKEAIRRAPNNSYIADTLGQIYKNWLKRTPEVSTAEKALRAFKDVENKAEREQSPEKVESEGSESFSITFNNRGLFGFMTVAKIIKKKLPGFSTQISAQEVQEKFHFFEWYLTYSRSDLTTYEPDYFWGDVAQCYEYYTPNTTASESTTFPGLLDCLNHGLFQSRGQRACLRPNVPDLETVQTALNLNFQEQTDDVKAAERYILSNILLCNQKPDSLLLAPVEDLQTITTTFMRTTLEARSPQFYLLVLMLFWPENQSHFENSENEVSSQDSGSQSREEPQSSDEQETDEELEGAPPGAIDLQQQVTNMEAAFKRVKYDKYLRGRYLVPLFFLGKGSGLRRWIHRSKLDAIVEEKVNNELSNEEISDQDKMKRISEVWSSGKVWHFPEIQNILHPVSVEPRASSATAEEQEEFVWVQAGRGRIRARTEKQPDASDESLICHYLGFNILGPIVFKVGPHTLLE